MHSSLPLLDATAPTPDETDDGGFSVGDLVLAVGFAPSGSRAWFKGRVTGFRPRFPPIVVKYYATLNGNTLPLALPCPSVAHLMSRDVKYDDDADGGGGPDGGGGGGSDSDSSEGGSDGDGFDGGGGGFEGGGDGPGDGRFDGGGGGSDGASDSDGSDGGGECGTEGVVAEGGAADGEPPSKRQKTIYCLADVSASFRFDLALFEEHRTIGINRLRARSACVPVTAANDVANCLRFLGWLAEQRRLHVGPDPLSSVFGSCKIATMAEDWLESLQQRRIKATTQAKYISSVLVLTSFVFEAGCPAPEALYMPVHPVQMLKNLRLQCEQRARQERRYSTSVTKWLDWTSVQQARVRAVESYLRCPDSPRAKKARLLTDVLILHLHSCQPPGEKATERLSAP